jgi:DNA-binding MarR family transcriptional regulator
MMNSHVLASIHILKAGFWQQKILKNLLAPYDLSHEQFNVLKILEAHQPKSLSLREVQSELLNQTANTTRLVEKLRRKGWLNRTLAKESRREVRISITSEGLTKLKEVKKGIVRFDAKLKNSWTKKEAIDLTKLLKKFLGE